MDAAAVRAKLKTLSGSPGTIETLSLYFGHWKSNANIVSRQQAALLARKQSSLLSFPPSSFFLTLNFSIAVVAEYVSVQIATVWHSEMVAATKSRKLFFLWLANDVLQKNR